MYKLIWTKFLPSVRALDDLCNALKHSFSSVGDAIRFANVHCRLCVIDILQLLLT